MNADELKAVIESHKKWLYNEGGERADLSDADLRGADLSDADLRCADLRDADLRGADLRGADLRDADLSDADLRDADLRDADLRGAYLRGADLRGANLTDIMLNNAVGSSNRIKCLQIEPYKIIVLDNEIAWGGCTKKTVKEWLAYKGDKLNDRDKAYLKNITKPFLRMCLKAAK